MTASLWSAYAKISDFSGHHPTDMTLKLLHAELKHTRIEHRLVRRYLSKQTFYK